MSAVALAQALVQVLVGEEVAHGWLRGRVVDWWVEMRWGFNLTDCQVFEELLAFDMWLG